MHKSATSQEVIGAGIWGRLLRSIEPALSTEVARAILTMKPPPEDVARMHELSAKARAGELSAAERVELDTYGEAGSVIGILQSQARMVLRKTGRTAKRAGA
jgi:hypothetical protein